MRVTFSRRWLSGLASLTILVGLTVAFLQAEEATKAADKPAAEKPADPAPKAEEKPTAEADEYAVPNGTPEELLKFIASVKSKPPGKIASSQELATYQKKTRGAIIAAANKILAADPKPDDKTVIAATKAKLEALDVLMRFVPTGAADFQKYLDELKADARPEIGREVRFYGLKVRVAGLKPDKAAELPRLVADLKKYLGEVTLELRHKYLVLMTAMFMEDLGKLEEAAEVYRDFGELFQKSKDKTVADTGVKFVNAARRVTLIGQPIEMAGKLLDGKSLDWAAYRGKVVLVDFWASWCKSCREEMPHVKEVYKAYYGRGFDVVGVNLDPNREAAEKYLKDNEIAWATMFSDDPNAAGWDHPLAKYYGVLSIPTAILVAPDGRVVSLGASGKELDQQLEKLLGPMDKKSDEKQAAGEAKPAKS
ncbi:MAG: TlpA family protein disulfide reductase [Pirellulales bacterium]